MNSRRTIVTGLMPNMLGPPSRASTNSVDWRGRNHEPLRESQEGY